MPHPAVIHCTFPGRINSLVAIVVVMIQPPIDHISDSLHAPVRVLVKHPARKPVLHQQKKRVSGYGVT